MLAGLPCQVSRSTRNPSANPTTSATIGPRPTIATGSDSKADSQSSPRRQADRDQPNATQTITAQATSMTTGTTSSLIVTMAGLLARSPTAATLA